MTEPYVRPDYWEFGYAEFDQLTMQATGSSTSGSEAALSLLVGLSGTGSSTTASSAFLNINVVLSGTSSAISDSYAELLKSNVDYTQAVGLVRNSIATAISGRALRKYPADKARFLETPAGSNLGLLLENSSTNLARYSEDISNAVWVKGSGLQELSNGQFWGLETKRYLISIPEDQTSQSIMLNFVDDQYSSEDDLYGQSVSANFITDTYYLDNEVASDRYTIYEEVTVSSSTEYSVSFYRRGESQTVIRSLPSGTEYLTSPTLMSSGIYRNTLTFVTPAGDTSIRVYTNDRFIANGQVIEATALQVEQSSFATSYVPTQNVDGIRVSDKYFVTEAAYSNLLRTLRTTIVLDVEETVNREAVILEARDTSLDLKIRIRKTTTTFICDIIDTGVVVATSSFPKPSGNRYMVVLTSGPRGIAFAVNSSARFITQDYRLTRLGNTLVGTDDLFVNKATDFNGLVKDIKFIHKEYTLVEITQMSSTSNFTVAKTID